MNEIIYTKILKLIAFLNPISSKQHSSIYSNIVKEAKIVKARDTPDAACILLTVEVLSKK